MAHRKKFTDLSDAELKQVIYAIFSPTKITNLKRYKRDDYITCTIYTEWETTDDDGKRIPELIPDELTLMNPFEWDSEAIQVDFQVNYEDYKILKQFCFAKGVYGKALEWMFNNPYINQ